MSSKPIHTLLRPEPNPLRDQVVRFLKQGILAGKYGPFLPSERKLAERIDVSRLTVRAALKSLEEEGLIELRGRKRFIVSPPEALPVDSECAEVVLLSAEPLEEVYHSHVLIFEMLREKLARHGFGLSINISSRFGMSGKGRVLEEAVEGHPDACWLLVRIPPTGQRWFVERKLRAMVLGTPDTGIEIPSLDTDYDATCFHAASLLASRGNRSIALVRRAADLIGDERSEAGMRRACQRASVNAFVYRLAGDSASVIDWLEGLYREHRLPDAIIACDPAIFMSVFSFCYRYGLRIPEDLAIICRTDDSLLDSIRPTVARYRINDSVFLNRLWRMLLPILRNQVYDKTPHFLMPDFVTGASAGALNPPKIELDGLTVK